MSKQNRTHLALGIILIMLAIIMLILKSNPSLAEYIHFEMVWPMWVVFGGVLFLLIGLLSGEPDMAVPASIFAGVGGILYYQQITQDWSSWSYLWTLIPGFAGVGNILSGFLGANFRKSIAEGFRSLIISILLFLVVASIFGKLSILGPNKDFFYYLGSG
jgi:hypothetical protein